MPFVYEDEPKKGFVYEDDVDDERNRQGEYFVSGLKQGVRDIAQGIGNTVAGGIRGAGSIGATLISPYDIAKDAIAGRGLSLQSNRERRQAMDYALRSLGAEPESLTYGGGKLAGEVAGTAGMGGLMAQGAQALGAAPSVVMALQTAGMTTGQNPIGFGARAADLGIRTATGAAVGGASAGLVNPEDAGAGAMVGGFLPAGVDAVKGAATMGRRFLGATTGVGDEALSQAYQAGKAGGKQAEQFTSAMRGQSSIDDALAMAKQNIAKMGEQKQQAYRSGMVNIKADKSVLSFDGIDDAIKSARSMSMFKGQAKNQKAAQLIQQASDEVAAWKALDPTEYHTPEGLDALKQRIGGMLESIPFEEKTARSAVGNIYSSIKGEINKQAPEYARVMKDYSEATELIREIEKTLSVGQKSLPETAARKLQSLMRNNVNTSYGYRDQLAQKMMDQGGNNLLPTLAGQSLNEWTPRGLQRVTAGTGTGLLAVTGNLPAAAGMAAMSSPRLVGESIYGIGRLAGQKNMAQFPQLLYRAAPIIPAQNQ